jgi:hypothetical protein
MEKAAAAEIANTAQVIKHTGMFDVVDRLYGDINVAMEGGGGAASAEGGAEGGGGGAAPAGGLGGGFGGGGTTGEDLDFGGEAGAEGEEAAASTEAGGEAGAAGEIAGAEETAAETPEATAEGIKKIENLLVEQKKVLSSKLTERTEKYQGFFVDKLINLVKKEEKPIESVKIYNKNIKINEGINTMIKDIDDMLED